MPVPGYWQCFIAGQMLTAVILKIAGAGGTGKTVTPCPNIDYTLYYSLFC